jgi:hypothetical protein
MSIDQIEAVRVRALKTFSCKYGYIIRAGEIAHFDAQYASEMKIGGKVEELEPVKAKSVDAAPRNQAIAAAPKVARPPAGKDREATPPTLPPALNSAASTTDGPARRASVSRRARVSPPKM